MAKQMPRQRISELTNSARNLSINNEKILGGKKILRMKQILLLIALFLAGCNLLEGEDPLITSSVCISNADGYLKNISGGTGYWEKVGYFFETSADCQNNRFTVDPASLSVKQYNETKQKNYTAKFYHFDNLETDLFVRQSFYQDKEIKPYNYDFIIPREGNKFDVYTVTGKELLVMALYGHVYFDDWGQALDSNQGAYQRVSGDLDGNEQRYPELFNVYNTESAFDYRPIWQKRMNPQLVRKVVVKDASAELVRQVAYLIDGIESGRVKTSKRLLDALPKRSFELIPSKR